MTARAPLSVLVVDDDFRVADFHATLVDAAPGFTTADTAGSVQAALTAASATTVDLALIDLYLPDGSGLDLLRGLDCDAFVLTAAAEGRRCAAPCRRGVGVSDQTVPAGAAVREAAALRPVPAADRDRDRRPGRDRERLRGVAGARPTARAAARGPFGDGRRGAVVRTLLRRPAVRGEVGALIGVSGPPPSATWPTWSPRVSCG
ncbi:response regulator [Streptomyces sp. M19]